MAYYAIEAELSVVLMNAFLLFGIVGRFEGNVM